VVDATTATALPTDIVGWSSVATSHFVVHYFSDSAASYAITQTQAGDIAALAERAYAAEVTDGYSAPSPDVYEGGSAAIDIYVVDLGSTGVLGYAQPDGCCPNFGYIGLNGSMPKESFDQKTVAHELFHLIQFVTWIPIQTTDNWLLEGSAEWMGYRTAGFTNSLDVGGLDISLDCRDPNGTSQCDLKDPYKDGGYSRWPFFEYLSERWGTAFPATIFQQATAHMSSATTALENAIAAKGSTLTDVFNDWTAVNLTGAYSVPVLQDILPTAYGSTISTGTLASLNAKTAKGAATVTSGPITPVTVSVNHLAARFVAIRHGNASLPDGPCYKATLSLNVALPAGVAAQPYFWWSQKNLDGTKPPAQRLTVTGSTASITLPWDTCDWASSLGYLALPNPTTSSDAKDFAVTGTLTVDKAAQATATPPPDPVKVAGTTIDAPTSGDVPRIEVFGPQLIHLSATNRVLRVIVSSSDSGSLKAALGSLALGSAKLRAGTNDVRFALPEKALRSLRTISTAANALTLTPTSASGAAGKSVVRKVALDNPVAKVKTKAKVKG
jgi:hypothetical protein